MEGMLVFTQTGLKQVILFLALQTLYTKVSLLTKSAMICSGLEDFKVYDGQRTFMMAEF